MKCKHLLFSLAINMVCLSSMASELSVEHVANAGVKITSGGKSVLIDALFGPHSRFNYPSDKHFARLSQQGADVALATHAHSDHFGANRVSQFLNDNPSTLFIGTPDMLQQLKDKASLSQLTTASLSQFQSKTFEHNNIKVTVLDFPHMQPRPGQAVNFAYLVQINGWRVLHVGDADINRQVIQGLNLADYHIDLALIHDLFPVRKKHYGELLKLMKPKKVAFVHMTDDKAEPLAQWLKDNLPEAGMLVTGYEKINMKKEP